MVKMLLERDIKTPDFTLGMLSIQGAFFCYTVEDTIRDKKIYAKTAIPAGKYKVTLTMSNRFKKLLPLLHNVPEFSGIRIHAGNTAADTEGCIIVGMNRTANGVASSRLAMDRLMEILKLEKVHEIEIV